MGRNLLGAVWRKVTIGPLGDGDFLNIVVKWYPELEPLGQKLTESFERVIQLVRFQLGLTASLSYHDRFTLRDLLKWCKRIGCLGFCFDQDNLSAYACNSIYNEAVDVFASFNISFENRLAIMREIAKLWTVSAAESLYPINKPIIQELGSDFQVGQVSLQCTETAFKPDKKPFVHLRSSVHIFERIACFAKLNEPVLLVGETGTGRTTLVQTLATRIGRKLIVLEIKDGCCTMKAEKCSEHLQNIGKIIWTKSLRRMYFLVELCYEMREPVLLVGETGGGKTTVCQFLSVILGLKLHVLN